MSMADDQTSKASRYEVQSHEETEGDATLA